MAEHTLKTLVKLPTETVEGREGKLTFLDNAVQDASGTIRLRATLPNADRRFWPGQFVSVRLVLTTKKSVLVSSSAPQVGQKGPYVYVVNAAGLAELRPVTLGQTHGDMVVIDSGVKPGEKVIVNGQLLVFPGGPVTVVDSPTSQPATAPCRPMPKANRPPRPIPRPQPAQRRPPQRQHPSQRANRRARSRRRPMPPRRLRAI